MGWRILLLLLVGLISVATAGAKTYTCRDSQGNPYFSDSPENLPASCQGKVEEVKPGAEGYINVVPAQPVPKVSPGQEKSSQGVEHEQQSRRQQVQQLQQLAEQLATSYEEAAQAKRNALRRWSYSSREKIKQADQQIDKAREGKKQLLQELGSMRIFTADEQKIRRTLDRIEDQ